MFGQPTPCIAVAGNGIAASALACLLRDSGYGVVMIARPHRRACRAAIIEALPQAAVHLIDQIGLTDALIQTRPATVSGFHNRHGEHRLSGVWTHVERVEFAQRCLTEARRRGATLVPMPAGHLTAPPGAAPQIRLGGNDIPVFAAVDATGRAARWSRPVTRAAPATATIYAAAGTAAPGPGVLDNVSGWWAYRLGHPRTATPGIIGETVCTEGQLGELAAAMDAGPLTGLTRVSTCSAAVQWAQQPVAGRRLAIGDAALALSPIAGQGVRFALSSALAAAAVLRTWAQGSAEESLASGYYRSFVEGVRQRHLAKLSGPQTPTNLGTDGHTTPIPISGRPQFIAPSRVVGQNLNGRIAAAQCFVLPDGGLVRSAGAVDLVLLQQAAAGAPNFAELCGTLTQHGVGHNQASALIGWALQHGVLACR